MVFRSWGSSRSRTTSSSVLPTTEVGFDPPECDVVLTRDHEYFVLQGICIAVRDRASGRYARQDPAMGVASLRRGPVHPRVQMPASGGADERDRVRSLPRIGEWLCLERGGTLHYVGPVIGCERRRLPSRRIVS